MSDIFLSYSRHDRELAASLAAELQRQGHSVWWDRHIVAGETFDDAIEAQLAEAACVVVLWTQASAQSEWVRNEASEAARRGVLVPALYGISEQTIPLEFRRRQAAVLTGWSDAGGPHAGLDQLLAGVRRTLGGVVSPGAAAAPRSAPAPAPTPAPTPATHPAPKPPPDRRMATVAWVLGALLAAGGLAWWWGPSGDHAGAVQAQAAGPASALPSAQAPAQGHVGGVPAVVPVVVPIAVPSSGTPPAAAPEQAALADALVGDYVGDIQADSLGPSRQHVALSLSRVDEHTVHIRSPQARIGEFDVALTRVGSSIQNDGGDHLLVADTSARPIKLSINPRNSELAWVGARR